MPSRLGTLLDMKTSSMERIIYFQDYVVVDPGDAPLKERQLLTEGDFRKAREQFGDTFPGRTWGPTPSASSWPGLTSLACRSNSDKN